MYCSTVSLVAIAGVSTGGGADTDTILGPAVDLDVLLDHAGDFHVRSISPDIRG